MNSRIIKNIIIAIIVPSVLSAAYFGFQYYTRKQKEKKILDDVKSKLEKNSNLVSGMPENILSQWKKALSVLTHDEFESFFKFFVLTIPYGKVKVNDKSIWVFENTHPEEFKVAADKCFKAIQGKEIEKLFNALSI